MKNWISTSITLLFLALATTSWAAANKANNDYTAVQNVIEGWFSAMKNNQYEQAAEFLAPQFVSIHTDGIVRDKAQEVDLIKQLQMKSYYLTQFKFSRSGNDIVVTYKDQGTEQIDNQTIAAKAAGRMAVLQKQGKKWLILAYANLDEIK